MFSRRGPPDRLPPPPQFVGFVARAPTDYEREFATELRDVERLRPILEVDENDLILGEALIRYLKRCVDAGRPNDESVMKSEIAAFIAGWNAACDATEDD